MAKLESLNLEKGLELNDLEKTLLALDKIIRVRAKEGKKGVILQSPQGKVKVSHKKISNVLKSLYSHYGIEGCFSFGVCKSCKKFNSDYFASGMRGMCMGKECWEFNTCDQYDGPGGFGREINRD